ncbi:uncharacterized protein LOC110843661 [Folsomia candida]|nr:uncharacterized protein LOC110843661 [Folsomia candida]
MIYFPNRVEKFYFIAIVTVLFSAQIVSSQVQGWDCYKCSSTTDELCLTNPEAISSGDVTVSNCTGYCTILRTEFTDIPGKVISLVRDCEKVPLVINEIRTDAHYTKYYRSCTTGKCNSGDGIIRGGGGNGNVPSEIIQVPERSTGSKFQTFNLPLLIQLSVLLKFLLC